MTITLQKLSLEQLRESTLNPRQHYDQGALAELAESLKASGQLEAILVRPVNGHYEIAAGHRRFRAAKLAGMAHLEAKVQEMDDRTFIEVLNVSNLQRDDLHPLEEAQGFRDLMERAGYDIPKIATRVGRSTKYVYDRIKLLQLAPEAKKLFWDGTIEAGHAILLARLTPKDQKRAIGNHGPRNRYNYASSESDGGLFQAEFADYDPEQPGLDLKEPVKARSVRELATWINDHIRFKPEHTDLPNLFPAAAAALEEAKGDDLQPVWITYDHQLKYDAKDQKVRTYGVSSWHRADGKKGSKTCAWSRIGIVAAGRDRGDAFRVCVNRDKCGVHFAAAKRSAKRRAAVRASVPMKEGEDSWARQERIRKAHEAARDIERARWKKAAPQLCQAIADMLRKEPAGVQGKIGRYLRGNETETCAHIDKEAAKRVSMGHSAEDLVRYIAYTWLASAVDDPWNPEQVCKELRAWGVDVKKILDEVAPKPAQTPAKKRATKPKAMK